MFKKLKKKIKEKIKIWENEWKEDYAFPKLLNYDEILYTPQTLKDVNKEEGEKLEEIEEGAMNLANHTSDDLPQGAVNKYLWDGAVTEIKLANRAVTNAKIAINAIQGDVIAAGAITETKIADNSISTPKLQAGSVIAAKIASGAIVAEKIDAGAVTTEKIAANAVTSDKVTTGELITLSAQIRNGIINNAHINSLDASKITTGYLSADRIATGSLNANKIESNSITANQIAANLGELVLTGDGGVVFKMPSSTGNPAQGGLIIKDSNGNPRLKINNHAFITSFNRAFAAASNTNGTFGNDWFQIYCEYDSVPHANVGVLEMPNTNYLLVKRSGGGAVVRMRGADGSGYIDLFEPLILRVRNSDPTGVQGMIFFHSGTGRFRGFDGTTWRDLCFHDERNT